MSATVTLTRIGISVVISAVIFLAVVIGLVMFSETQTPRGDVGNLQFKNLQIDDSTLPPLQHYEARDGQQLPYRYYAGGDQANVALILVHGSAGESRYLQPLASYLAEHHIADVYTPDLRGHGPQTDNRGDVAYIGQIEDDLSDLVRHVRHWQDGPVVLGGHSSGGGTVIRYAGGDNAYVDGYLLLAPYMRYDAPTVRPDTHWANPNVPRIIGLKILNTLGITAFNHKNVISFNMPKAVRDGSETLYYSYALQVSMHPRSDYGKDISSMDAPSFLLVGTEDQAFKATAFKPLFARYSPGTEVTILEDASHFGVVTEPSAQEAIATWLRATY